MSAREILEAWHSRYFAPVLNHEDVEEIAINTAPEIETDPPAIMGVKRRSTGQWEPYHCALTRADLVMFAYIVAHTKHQNFSPAQGYLFETLPGNARLTLVHGPATRFRTDDDSGIALLIRQGDAAVKHGGPIPLERAEVPARDHVAAWADLPEELRPIVTSMRNHQRGLLLIGPLGSGKTTMLRKVLATISELERIILTEDTREIDLTYHWNHLPLFAPRNQTAPWDAIRSIAMRSTGTALVLGELNEIISSQIPELATIGFKEVHASLHEKDPIEGLARLRTLMARLNLPMKRFVNLMTNIFEAIVVMEQIPGGGRRIASITPMADACRELEDRKDV